MPGGGGGAGVRKGARGKYSAVSLGLQSGHAHTFHLGVLRLCLPELGGWGVGQFPRPWGGGGGRSQKEVLGNNCCCSSSPGLGSCLAPTTALDEVVPRIGLQSQ